MIHPVRREIDPAAVSTQPDFLFDHLFAVDFEFHFALGDHNGGIFITIFRFLFVRHFKNLYIYKERSFCGLGFTAHPQFEDLQTNRDVPTSLKILATVCLFCLSTDIYAVAYIYNLITF